MKSMFFDEKRDIFAYFCHRNSIVMILARLRYVCIVLPLLLVFMAGCRRSDADSAALLERGVQSLNHNNMVEAYQSTVQAIEAAKESGDSGVCLEAKTFLGILYYTMGQDGEAYNTFRQLPLDSARGRRPRVFLLSISCMAYYAATIDHDYPTAISYCKRVIDGDRYSGDRGAEAVDMLNMAEIYLLKGDTTKAKEIIHSTDTTGIGSYQRNFNLQLQLNIARLSMLRHDYDTARRIATEMTKETNSYWDINSQITLLDIITHIDSMRSDTQSYIFYRNKEDSLRSKVQGEQMRYKLILTREQYRMENLKMEAAKRRTLYNGGIASLVVVVVLLGIISSMQYRKAKMQKSIIEMERNKFDADISHRRLENELLQLKMQQQKEELSQAYQDNVNMSVLLDETPDSTVYATRLEYLEAMLKRQHGDLIKRLSRRYPHLSYNETLIIGFTRMGLSPKDIAQTLGISQESLTKARYRLRKKLGLDSSKQLDTFISEL